MFKLILEKAEEPEIKLPDVLFLCEPNNPTGVATDRKRLEEILDACKQAGTTLVIDECFNGFLDEPEAHTMKSYLGPDVSRGSW